MYMHLVACEHSVDEEVGVGSEARTGRVAAGHQTGHERAVAHIYTREFWTALIYTLLTAN